MKTTPVTKDDLTNSVIAVPPLPRSVDGTINAAGIATLTAYLRAGGVITALWGGNANLYNMGLAEFASCLDAFEAAAPGQDWAIPSIGPDFGKAMDQINALQGRNFPTVMVLPLSFPTRSAGVATGLRRIADAYGKPIVAYVKSEGYLDPVDLGRLVADGVISFVKYAVVRDDPSNDPYLDRMLEKIPADIMVSGIGERPVIPHLTKFGLTGFTSGSVCVAPNLSDGIRRALLEGDSTLAAQLREAFLPLEDLRDGFSPILVLHHAVALANIVATGEPAPFLAPLSDPQLINEIEHAARTLADKDTAVQKAVA
ncbi:MAG: dihydrodipicolinate synthase family protein [Hyphomicrobiales bacterium]